MTKRKLKYIIGFFGLPCTGKGSVIREFVRRRGMPVVSTGTIVSRLLTDETRKAMENGGLFPHEEPLRAALKKEIDDYLSWSSTNSVVLDGFPRFSDQLSWLIESFEPFARVVVVQVAAPIDVIRKRAAIRARDVFDTDVTRFDLRVAEQSGKIDDMERFIRSHGVHYYSVHNDGDVGNAVSQLNKLLTKGGISI